MPVPRQPFLEGLVLAAGPALAAQLGEVAGEVLVQPLPDGLRKVVVGDQPVRALALVHVCRITYQALAR